MWADYPDKPAYNYPRSKVLAERDAWELVRASDGATELVTVLPAFIQGPVLGADFSASVDVVAMMLRGKMPAVPRLGLTIVDIRDIADLHVRAMTAPVAAGERFIGGGDFLWLSDIARILRDNLGDAGKKAPRRTIPDLVVRLGALVNAEMAQVAPNLGTKRPLSAAKAERLLGWKTRPAEESILDGAHSLLSRGRV